MHDNTLVYGRFKYTRGIIFWLAGDWRARREGSAAPPALGDFGGLGYRPLRTGLTSGAPAGLVGWRRDVLWKRFALDRLMGGCEKAEAFLFWSGQEGDPSSRRALLWMTANCGLSVGLDG
jgi:hypothetical protein